MIALVHHVTHLVQEVAVDPGDDHAVVQKAEVDRVIENEGEAALPKDHVRDPEVAVSRNRDLLKDLVLVEVNLAPFHVHQENRDQKAGVSLAHEVKVTQNPDQDLNHQVQTKLHLKDLHHQKHWMVTHKVEKNIF